MNYLADAPWSHKKSAAVSLVRRALTIPSEETTKKSALEKARNTLRMNQWPEKVIQKITQQQKRKLENESAEHLQSSEKPTLTLPWIDSRTEDLLQKIRRIGQNRDIEIRTATRTEKLRQVCNNKAKMDKRSQSNVVYQITCPACNGRYVGQTSRHLHQRLQEHDRGNTALHNHGCEYISTIDAAEILYIGTSTYGISR